MAHIYSKGWYVQQLKYIGISKHEDRKLESYKTHILAKLYQIHVVGKNNQ